MDVSNERYQKHGYKNRKEYLRMLSDEYSVPYSVVLNLAVLLGTEEDFDALVSEIEDYSDDMEEMEDEFNA